VSNRSPRDWYVYVVAVLFHVACAAFSIVMCWACALNLQSAGKAETSIFGFITEFQWLFFGALFVLSLLTAKYRPAFLRENGLTLAFLAILWVFFVLFVIETQSYIMLRLAE